MYCIGIDVSKQELVTYDGERRRTFPNTADLEELAAFLKKKDGEVTVVFEPTSTYSRPLELLCRTRKVRCWCLNPRVIPHLREVSQGRSKTDRTDAELLWQYGQDHGPGQLLEEDNLGRALKASLSWDAPVFCTNYSERTADQLTAAVSTISLASPQLRAAYSAGVRYPRELCGRNRLYSCLHASTIS